MNNKMSKYVGESGTEPYDASLVEQFHESTKFMPSTALARDQRISNYLFSDECIKEASLNFKSYHTFPKIKLPQPRAVEASFDAIINQRESCREFSGEPLSLLDVSSMLNYLAINRVVQPLADDNTVNLNLRKYPSPGGLYSIEVYLIASNVAGLDAGIYHYGVKDQSLCTLAAMPPSAQIARALGDHDASFVDQTGMVILLTGVLPRLTVKYENQGYRFALIESGIVGLQLNLAAEGLGLGCLLWGGAYDDLVHDLIGVDGVEEVLLNVMWLGNKA